MAFLPGRAKRVLIAVAALAACSSLAFAQFGGFGFGSGGGSDPAVRNAPYDGRFTFVRLKYATAPGGYWYQGLPSWAHGYPLSEDNLVRIMNEVSLLGAHVGAYNVFSLDDPELFRYPLAYITEAGWWTMTDEEGAAFRKYLLKGGFVIVDDFKVAGDFNQSGGGWETFDANVQRMLPGARYFDLKPEDKIFHSFFEIRSLTNFPQAYNAGQPVFRGVYEDNDPRKRLLMVINYNTDISQYWEWSGRGLRPFDDTNEAYKLGVNYLIHALTH